MMIKRFVCIGAAFILGAVSVLGQDKEMAPARAKSFYVNILGGPVFNLYENAFSYRDNGRAAELFTAQGSVAIGYDFSETFGVRLMSGFGNDAGACNTRETAGGGFYPYSFKHVNLFADTVLDLFGLADNPQPFRPKLYTGLGCAHTFGFTDAQHPWQKVTDSNTAFGFRAGVILEYTFPTGLGLMADFCGEAYTDGYNGLRPTKEEQKEYEGYGGYPLDLRGILSLGVVYHF